MNSYTIKIDHFEGPFDLLLFFIERDELDINDIPISKITKDFLDYIHQLERLNIDVASEFILVAATLMKIKARLLIPRKEIDEFGNEIDPREELAQKLIEYKRFKETIGELQDLEKERALKFERGLKGIELKQLANKAMVDSEMESLSLYKLLQTFHKALDKYNEVQKRPTHKIIKYNYTIQNQQDYLRSKVANGRSMFKDLFEEMENRIHAIITFLALLELLNLQQIKLTQGEGFNNFWLEAA